MMKSWLLLSGKNKVCALLELYYFLTATCAYKVRLTLAEKGVDFMHRVLDRDAGDLVTPAYLAMNPNAVVPTMVHEGQVIIESSIIMTYCEEAFEGPRLLPDDALLRARIAAWMKKADDLYLPATGAVTYGVFRRKEVLTKTAEQLAVYYADIPDETRRAARRQVVEQGIMAPATQKGIKTLYQMLSDMEDALAEQRFLSGETYGLADAALTPFVSRLEELSFAFLWEGFPHLKDWWQAIKARPSFGTVFNAYPNEARKHGLRTSGEEVGDIVRGIISDIAGDNAGH